MKTRLFLVSVISLVLAIFLLTGNPTKTTSQQQQICSTDAGCTAVGTVKKCNGDAAETSGTTQGNYISVQGTVENRQDPNDPTHYYTVNCTITQFYNCTGGSGNTGGGGFSIPGCPLGG